ncbi:hypothetical protein [Lactiplantibacillus plantarum]|uniref:hypothetical protein n=1 Tax=Lactiplantibacillus plantarum TaxID=1590 RepID=UPI0012B6C1DB|nr:hypothetical protein [Lactiplantibacillus plantarum]
MESIGGDSLHAFSVIASRIQAPVSAYSRSSVAERPTYNWEVAGSSPAGYVAGGFIRGDALLSAAGISLRI